MRYMRKFSGFAARSLCAMFAIVVLTANSVDAANRTASVTGEWNDQATWGGATVPGADDNVTINSGITVTISGYAAVCNRINFTTGTAGDIASITLADANSSLTTNDRIKIQRPGNNNINQIDVGAGTLTTTKIILQGTVDSNRLSQILISTGTVTVSGNITSEGASSRITFSGSGTLNVGNKFLSGTAGTFTASTSTVNFNKTGNQTISPFPYTFNNVILSGSGKKKTTNATINGILSMEGTATTNGTVATYGPAATLQYKGTAAQTTGTEFPAIWTGSGGVIIANTSGNDVTLDEAKIINAPLIINSNATLNTDNSDNYALALGGDFINSGTFIANASPITIRGTETTQSIAGFSTTGSVSMTKDGGTATFTGNVSGSRLTINGAGGTLNLGVGQTHTFTGSCIITDGTLNGNSSTLNIEGDFRRSGTFTAETSTIVFNGTGISTISDSNTFNNLTCTTANKFIRFQSGTTQIVDGKFQIDGGDIGTRVSLASTGGAGTTWDLVLNGSYDCRYVAVQGSTASGTAFLPINPVGFKDNSDNTNWYDSTLPAEMIFYDDFETSTLGSAPPDKTSSYWDISTASWLTQAATVVNTQNHTSGGSQSMYSSGGASGQGVGAWNSPAWGPQTNCTAEAWFYDDMQNNKMQWLCIDNAAGSQGVGVLVETNQGQGLTKYRYCRFNFGGGTLYADSYIDRTLGWHKVKWVHTDGTVDLYLDGALIMTASGLSDFSAFDTGSWTWHNSTGSTPMWFDDFIVYRSQHQSAYRWYDNNRAQTPSALAALNTPISRDSNTTTRLRIQIQNDQHEVWAGNFLGLQYREGLNGTWTNLGASADWNYADGLGTDGARIVNDLLANTDVRQHFIESVPSTASIAMTYAERGEWDFTLRPTPNATVGATYYIRPVITDATGAFSKAFAAYLVLAECQVTSPTLKIWTGANSSDWNDPGNWAGTSIPDSTFDVIIPAGTPDCRINIADAICKSILVEDGASMSLDTASTSLTVVENITVHGTVTHSDATAALTLNSGTLRIDGNNANYNHTGNGTLNASNAVIQVINGGSYNVSGNPIISAQALLMSVGGLIDVSGAAIFNVDDFSIDLNGQWLSSNTGNIVNITNNFTNNGSMLGSTGGVFNFNGAGGSLAGNSTTTIFYQANFNSDTTVTMTNTITVLDDLVIDTGDFLTASSGTIKVGGDWINRGTFIHGGGTIELNGTALQQITAAGSDFYNLVQTNASGAGVTFLDNFTTTTLTNTTGNSTMTFNAGSTYNITGTGGLTLTGTAGNLVTLVSSTPGTVWNINPSGAGWSVDYVDVSDSFNSYEDPILPTNTVDNGTTINWFTSDFDTDEIPDYYEYAYYGTLANDPDSDTDGDDLTLIEEFVLEEDPTVSTSSELYVDDNAGYIGDGSSGAPFKYLKDALDAATDGTLIILEEGTYELDNYLLTKRVIIRGDKGAVKTIIHGGAPDGSSSDSGSFLQVTSKNFALEHVTLRMFRDDKPIITCTGSSNVEVFMLDGVIFRDNNTQTKAMIVPSATGYKRIYMYNCLFYDNSSLSGAILDADKDVRAYNNTLVDNTFTSALILNGIETNYKLYNDILRNSSTEITDNSSGTLIVDSCNIKDLAGVPYSTVNCYDTAETFADSANGYYNLLTASAGEDAGLTTKINWDLKDVPRSQSAAFDVGAYETDPNDQDGDGLTDVFETANGYNQLDPDTDGDGLTDGEEINTYETDPLLTNSDGDFVDDGYEVAMGMDPSVYDGVGDIDGIYYTSFESDVDFPVGPLRDTAWGPNGNINNSNVIVGNMTIENVGEAAAYDGVKIAKAAGQIPESSFIGWVDRLDLDDYWISISWKTPRAKLPTDLNEAFNTAGAFMAIDENGYLNVWDPSNEEWLIDTQIIPDDWVRITVHRNHFGKTVDVWVETRQAFANIPTSDPDPTAGTGKFRMSMSSVGEQDAFTDLWSTTPDAPF